MVKVLLLYLIILGKINFLQLGRYSHFGKQRYRQQFSPKFDWLSFNVCLPDSHIGNRTAITFDPSYISKSGVIPYNKGKSKTFCLHVQAGGFSKEFSLRLKSEKIHLKKTLRLRFLI